MIYVAPSDSIALRRRRDRSARCFCGREATKAFTHPPVSDGPSHAADYDEHSTDIGNFPWTSQLWNFSLCLITNNVETLDHAIESALSTHGAVSVKAAHSQSAGRASWESSGDWSSVTVTQVILPTETSSVMSCSELCGVFKTLAVDVQEMPQCLLGTHRYPLLHREAPSIRLPTPQDHLARCLRGVAVSRAQLR